MSVLARSLETAGIATTAVALIRPHAERVRPPRALWVPFQLGRPIGAPDDAAFQTRVLRAALSLLERESGPVLEDFPDDEPGTADDPAWSEPETDPGLGVEAEIERLEFAWTEARERHRRTTVGLSGLSPRDAATFVARHDGDRPVPNPRRDLAEVQTLRFAVDDLKAYCLEAAAARGRPTSRQLARLFWTRTATANATRSLLEVSLASDDAKRRLMAWWLVPDEWLDEATVARIRATPHG